MTLAPVQSSLDKHMSPTGFDVKALSGNFSIFRQLSHPECTSAFLPLWLLSYYSRSNYFGRFA